MLSFMSLVVQNTGLIILSRIYVHELKGRSTEIVLFSDLWKLAACIVYDARGILRLRRHRLRALAVLAAIYATQTNLLMYALQHINAPLFQTIQQSKTLMTAFLSVHFLNTTITRRQWMSLILLTCGMFLVTCDTLKHDDLFSAKWYGVFATALASLLSAISSVFFEKKLRDDHWSSAKTHSLIDTNLHLAVVSLPFVTFPATKHTWAPIDCVILVVSATSGVGGLLVAWVTQELGSVYKCLATALSIVCGCVCSALFLKFDMNAHNTIGIMLTVVACILYVQFSSSTSGLPSFSAKRRSVFSIASLRRSLTGS